MVERLTGLADAIVLVDEAEAPRRSPGGVGIDASNEVRMADRVGRLADDARIRAYETLGDRPRAVQIMERQLSID